jgi:hypothetical protein
MKARANYKSKPIFDEDFSFLPNFCFLRKVRGKRVSLRQSSFKTKKTWP